MEEILHLILKTYGVVGLIVAAPYAAVVYLWKDNRRLGKELVALAEDHTKALDTAGGRVTEVQEKRIADAQGISTKLMTLMAERSSLDKETNLALDRIGDMVSLVVNNHHYSGKRGPG